MDVSLLNEEWKSKVIAWLEKMKQSKGTSSNDEKSNNIHGSLSSGLFDTILMDSNDPFGLVSENENFLRNESILNFNGEYESQVSEKKKKYFMKEDIFAPCLDFKSCFKPYGKNMIEQAIDPFLGLNEINNSNQVIRSKSIDKLKNQATSSSMFDIKPKDSCDPFLIVDEEVSINLNEEKSYDNKFIPRKIFSKELYEEPKQFNNILFKDIPKIAFDPFEVNDGEKIYNFEVLEKMYYETHKDETQNQQFEVILNTLVNDFIEVLLQPPSESPEQSNISTITGSSSTGSISKNGKKKKKRKMIKTIS